MKKIPIVKSKLTMPQLPESMINSDRIKKLINIIQRKNTVIITAPSGYGKTTLMMAALNSQKDDKCRICWYRLEQEDRDLAVFYAYLFEALFPSDDPQWDDTHLMFQGFGEYQSQYQYINAIICQELWSYCSRHPGTKTYISFDDFQNVKDSPEIAESISYLIYNLPDNCIVLLSSRQQVNILTEKQKLEKSIAEINQKDLCFMETEISEFLMKSFQTNAGKKLTHKILKSTEGWIAGVIMVCNIISDFGIVETENLLEQPWQKAKLFNYITSEVLKTVDRDIMLFLVKVSILQDFTPKEANEILQIQNTVDLVSLCEKKGLFIQRIIRDNITYRFHSLFREALLQLQPEYITAEEIKDLNLKAAAYYIDRRIYDKAIEHFIVCGDMNSAVELITKESVTLITFEAVEQLRGWFNLLPEDVIEQNPRLLYIKSFTYYQGKSKQPMLLMEKASAKFKEQGDALMQVNALMTLTNYGMMTNRKDYALEYVSQALEALKPFERELDNKYMSQVFLFIRAVFEENFSTGLALFKKLKDIEMLPDWKWMILVYANIMGCLNGDLELAESAIKNTFNMDLVRRAALFKGFALTYYSNVLYLKNDTSGLAAIEKELEVIGEKYDLNYMLGFGRRAAAYRKYALHDPESAIELLDLSINNFEQYGNHAMAAINRLSMLLWLSRQKKSEEQLHEAGKALRSISSMNSSYCIIEIGQSIFGAIARECGEYTLAEEYLISSINESERKGARQITCGSYIHLAKLYFDIDQREKAEDCLKKAFRMASSHKYTMFWDIHLPTLTEMSLRCMKSGICTEFIKELMEFYFKRDAVRYIERNISLIDNASMKDFSKKILSKYGVATSTDYTCTINVRLFGRFGFSINSINIPDEEWKTKKIKGILQYLVLNKGTAISRDQLMEIFWPNSDKKSASVSLRAALYELKKVLNKYGVKSDGDSAFIHEKTGSLEIKPNNMLTVDTDEFISLYDEYKSKHKKGFDNKPLMTILERMNSVYSGDLLPEEIYADWTFADRETFKSIFQETTTTLATLYIYENETHQAEKLLLKVMSIDPYNEEVCLLLLKLYVLRNQRSRATKLYSEFEKRLMKDLNIKPCQKLTLAAKDIV